MNKKTVRMIFIFKYIMQMFGTKARFTIDGKRIGKIKFIWSGVRVMLKRS